MDSLEAPYIPIDRRVSGKGFSDAFKQRFTQMFGDDLEFIPKTSENDVPLDLFFFNKELATERDLIFHQLMSGLQYQVISHTIVPLQNSLFKSIWILEIHGNASDQYNTVMYFERHDGKFQTIFENLLPYQSSKLAQIKYE